MSQAPGTIHCIKIQYDLTLATNEKGWLGSGMDDIYEHRIPLTPEESFKPGNYTFRVEQIMREDPLKNVLNVGLRVEKEIITIPCLMPAKKMRSGDHSFTGCC